MLTQPYILPPQDEIGKEDEKDEPGAVPRELPNHNGIITSIITSS